MLMINKESARKNITAIKEKLADPEKRTECIAKIENLIDMKQSHIWRAESIAPCCGNICGLTSLFETEIEKLQSTLNALKKNDNAKAAVLLEDYLTFIDKNYKDETSIALAHQKPPPP
jgi:hypothetical protein